MSDPTQPPVDPTRNDPTSSQPAGPSVPPAYGTPAAPAYPSSPAPGIQAAPAYGQPAAYGQNPYGQQNAQDKYNVLAIISLVSAFFVSLVAVITGHMAMSQIKKTGEKGYGLALWGLILGYLGIVSGIIFVGIFIAILVSGAATSSSFNSL
ncbi:DUF4190 domain-containing protein [Cryobacterium sp. TMT1-3]|uniref:DUF4190 domain-containing protein n=1 Tax=Cryobacterium luteum TaxID=1424661 RepID=A0A1H8C8B5_9MICO|nr:MULTISPECIES: DUF4190 domain-containing protein [Cryobacterium]TFB89269.1 DUF4190 domain-containing protein [Cryobacterium luteum]TFC27421.1 DUF4190 domain-containing protein [Cryobacterium sp. TMT1-3]SEM90694.1 protein of unknown function [Cryobacterium luteum]